MAANDRGAIGWPDVLARFQVRGRVRPPHRNASLTEGCEIIAVGDVIAEVITHGTCYRILGGVASPSCSYPAVAWCDQASAREAMYRADCLQFASTNLVLELGINHPVLIGNRRLPSS
jgi:hypothetical protein